MHAACVGCRLDEEFEVHTETLDLLLWQCMVSAFGDSDVGLQALSSTGDSLQVFGRGFCEFASCPSCLLEGSLGDRFVHVI